jgi:hypothetical protein
MGHSSVKTARDIASCLVELTNDYCASYHFKGYGRFVSQSEFERRNKELWDEARKLGLELEVRDYIDDFYGIGMKKAIANLDNPQETKENSDGK